MSKTIWDFINSICDKKKLEYDEKVFSSYVTALHFSQDKNTIQYSDEINHLLFLLPGETVYNYFFSKVPKGKRWIKWPKKTKEKESKKMKAFQEEHQLSSEEMKKYIEFF